MFDMLGRRVRQTRMLLIGALIVVLGMTSYAPLFPQATIQAESDPVVPLLFSPPEELGTLASSPVTNSAAYGVENGKPVMYTTVTGGTDNPAMFSVIDMTDYRLIRTMPLEQGNGAADGHIIDSKGNVYVIAKNGIYRYVPGSVSVERVADVSGATALYGLAIDENDTIYGGTYPTGSVFKFNTVEEELTVFPQLSPGKEYVRSVAYYKGTLYAGTGAVGELWKLDPATGQGDKIPFPQTSTYLVPSEVKQVYTLSISGSLMFILTSNQNLLIYDLEAQDWYDGWSTDEQHKQYYRGMHVSPQLDGKIYLNMNREFYSFDQATGVMEATGMKYDHYIRGAGWVELGNENGDMPGKSLATLYNGGIVLVNFTTKNMKVYDPVVPGQAVSIQSLEFGPDGKLYGAGYLGSFAARYDTRTGVKEEFNMGQAEGMIPYNGKMIFGEYAGAFIHEMDPALPIQAGVNPKTIHHIGGKEDRPFAMATGEGKLFVGTIPQIGTLGGALTIHDGSSWVKHENLIHNQSVMGLAYREGTGLLYGSTTVWGGLGIEPTEQYAKIFVWDVAEGKLVKELIPGIKQQNNIGPKAIGALSFGPDGLLWGAAYGTLFAMDPDTFEIVKEKEIHPTSWAFSHVWVPAKLRWGDDGFLYTTLGGVLTVVDPETMAHTVIPGTKANLMVVGMDNVDPEKTAIYYSEASMLKKITVTPGAPPAFMDVEIPIANSGFEQVNLDGTIPGWDRFGSVSGLAEYDITTENPKSDTRSLKVTDISDQAEAGIISIPFPVQPGLEYKAKTNVFLDSGRGAIYALKYYDADGNEVTPSPAPAAYIEGPKGVWSEAEFKSIAPANAVTGKLALFVSYAWTGTVYFDNVRLYEGRMIDSPAGAAIQHLDVPNPGFEQSLNEDGSIPGWTVRNPETLVGTDAKLELSSEQAKSGNNSLYMYDNDTALAIAIDADLIPVEPGVSYTYNADVYRTTPPPGRSSNNPWLQVRYHDSQGKELPPTPPPVSQALTTTMNTWVNGGFTSTAPAAAHFVRLIVAGSGNQVSSAYIDNITLTRAVERDEVTELRLQRAAAPSLIAGEDATFTVTATAGADIIVKDGSEIAATAIATGAGMDTPVTIAIPRPAVGTHNYEVYANVPGIGKSHAVMLPPVTVYDFSGYALNTGDELTLAVGETFSVFAKARFGPLTKDVTTELSIRSASNEVVTISDHAITAIAPGEVELDVAIGDAAAPFSRIVVFVEGEPPRPTIGEVQAMIDAFASSGDVKGALIEQLSNSARQADHHFSNGRTEQAGKHMEDFLKHLHNKAMANHVTEKAKTALTALAERLIDSWR